MNPTPPVSTRFVTFVVVAAVAVAHGVAQQPRASGSGVITGIVVADASGLPARDATVTLKHGETVVRTGAVDEQGRFAFEDLPPGTYTVAAVRQGYLAAAYGQRRPGSGTAGTPVDLADRQRIDNITIRLARGGAVSGTILDDRGEPLYPAVVTALRRVVRGGVRSLADTRSALTDDRGFYRIGVLPPGEYLIRVAVRSALTTLLLSENGLQIAGNTSMLGAMPIRVPARSGEIPRPKLPPPPAYYPGTTTPSTALSVDVTDGAERTGLDFTVRPAAASGVSGSIVLADGRRVTRGQLFLFDRELNLPPQQVYVSTEGGFEIAQLPPGRYSFVARAAVASPGAGHGAVTGQDPSIVDGGWFGDPDSELLSGALDVTVDGTTVGDLTLVLERGSTISGTVVFDGGLPRDPASVVLGLVPVGPTSQAFDRVSPSAVTGEASGRFTIRDVPPGTYRWTVSGLAGWFPRSLVVLGLDGLDTPLEVSAGTDVGGAVLTLADRSAEVSGVLEDTNGRATAGYTVMLFPADEAYWRPGARRIRAAQTSTDGRYAFTNLPAGAYLLAVATDLAADAWFDPAFLRELARAGSVAITLADAERRTQDLQIKRAP